MLKNLTFLIFLILEIVAENGHERFKRYLLFTQNTQLQFSTGLTVPVVLPRRSININIVYQANYLAPYNLSNFQPMVISARDKEKSSYFDITRETFYTYIIEFLDSFGLDGETCLLRSICEIAEFPMHIKEEETLLEKIVHYVFTPSLSLESRTSNQTAMDEAIFSDQLLTAEEFGRKNGNCENEYSDCIISIVDIFTKKYMF